MASFVVNVPSNRLFEIVCTTDPQLLRAEYRGRRNAQNFFTSRSAGLLRAPAGHATYLVPTDQLKRFAGRPRIYYALASYDSARGSDPKLSVMPDAAGEVPNIQLAMDFTGRSLDRARIRGGVRDGRYGGTQPVLTWGGDALAAHTRAAEPSPAADYDDGFPPSLWTSQAASASTSAAAAPPDPHEPPPPETSYDERGLDEAYGRRSSPPSVITSARREPEPAGFEDAAALRSAGAVYGRASGPAPATAPAVYGRGPTAPTRASTPTASEPPGAEDVRALPAAYGRRGPAGEPPGVEDARGVARYGAVPAAEPPGVEDVRVPGRYGDPAPAASAPEAMPPAVMPAAAMPPAAVPPAPATAPAPVTTSTSDVPGRGVDDSWSEDDDEADLVSSATAAGGEPLTIRRKFEILLPVAAFESGDRRYTAVLGSVEHEDATHAAYQRVHHGLHWGLVLFTQRSGTLGKVLVACERRDPAQFRQTFGAQADRLVQVTTAASPDARLAPVGSALLWTRAWMDRFRAAGRIQAFQAAQNEIAIEHYCDRNLGFASALGLTTDRALAMVLDRAIHMGVAGGRQWILQAVSPITDDAKRAAALAAVGHADLTAFQRAANLAPTGQLGTQTHAALLAALRALGDRAPFAMPTTAEMLDRLVAAAAGRRFEQRVRELRASTHYTDAVQRVI